MITKWEEAAIFTWLLMRILWRWFLFLTITVAPGYILAHFIYKYW